MITLCTLFIALLVLDIAAMRWGATSSDGLASAEWRRRQDWPVARLDDPLAVLTGGPRSLPLRQQTLRNTLFWSYQLLSAWEQRLFRLLSVFAGGCSIEAAEAVLSSEIACEQEPYILDGIASLMSKSLVFTVRQEGEPSRLFLLETVREYGLECLEASGEAGMVRAAHARYYLHLAEEAEQRLSGQDQAWWLARLERDHCNLQAALTWSLDQHQPEKGASRETSQGFSAFTCSAYSV